MEGKHGMSSKRGARIWRAGRMVHFLIATGQPGAGLFLRFATTRVMLATQAVITLKAEY